MYQTLDPAHIIKTIERVKAGIDARFPVSGLGKVCAELIETARYTSRRAAALSAPNWPLRTAVAALIVMGVLAQIASAKFLHIDRMDTDFDLLQTLEAAVNLLILFAGAVWFLVTLEERVTRQRALDELHKLRSLAHVIDMHQLSKDPTELMNEHKGRNMKKLDLVRYLDHCAEMLALIGKLAALYADRMRDSAVIQAVNEIESLTSDLSRKIWQKITILSALEEEGVAPPPAPSAPGALS